MRVLNYADEHTEGVEFLDDLFVVAIFRALMLKAGDLTRDSVRILKLL